MMRKLGMVFVFFWSVRILNGAQPEPVLAIDHATAWGRIYGPLFALYADGTVVVRKGWKAGERQDATAIASYVTFRVPDGREFCRALFPYNPKALKAHYELTSATDQDETSIWISGHVTRIYGERNMPARWADLDQQTLEQEREKQASLPNGLRRLLEKIEELSSRADGASWCPPSCDISFVGYDYAPGVTTPWPAKWRISGFHPPADGRLAAESVSFPGTDIQELLAFTDGLPERGAIGIEGHKVAVGTIFIRFPKDIIWMRAIRDSRRAYEQGLYPSLYTPGMTPKRWRELRRLLGAG